MNLILLFSNTGGKDIIHISRENHFNNIKRSDYDITEFQRALANAAFTETGFSTIFTLKKIIFFSIYYRWIMACIIN